MKPEIRLPLYVYIREKHSAPLLFNNFAADFHQISKYILHFGNLLEKHLSSARSAADFQI